jgi:N6-L-threonylcarbamoyladenine synthase
MIILGVETSCDETAVAVLEGTGDPSPSAIKLRSNIIASQIALHRQFGGVVPEVASRCHVETIIPVIDKALSEAGVCLSDITAVAATHGPGLVGAVLVGLSAAKALALAQDIPFIVALYYTLLRLLSIAATVICSYRNL